MFATWYLALLEWPLLVLLSPTLVQLVRSIASYNLAAPGGRALVRAKQGWEIQPNI